MADQIYDAVIIGAGPTGACLSLGLAQICFRVAIIDSRDVRADRRPDGRNFAIVSGSWRLLQRLGVASALNAKTQPLIGLEAVDGGEHRFTRPSALFSAEDLESSDPDETLGHMIRAEDLQAELDTRLNASQSIDWRAPAHFSGLSSGDGSITVHLEGADRLQARLLIGADGLNSPVRHALNIGTEGRDYKQSVLTANVKLSAPHKGIARQVFTPEGPFATLPLPDNHANLAWYMRRGAAEALVQYPVEAIEAELNARFSDFAGHMQIINTPGSYPLMLQLAQSLTAHRAALIGDAARRVTPLAGQGLNQGFRDVAALIESADAAIRIGDEIGSAQMLQAYSQARRFEGVATALLLDGIDRLFSNDYLATKPVRALGLFAAARIGPLRRAMTQYASASEPGAPAMMDLF